MPKAGAKFVCFLFLLLLIGFPIFAQNDDDDNDPSIESDWDDYFMDLYVRGDQTFTISLGTFYPAFFINDGKLISMNFTPPVGGMGSLIYNYYFGPRFFIGGEITGQFINTLRKNTLFIVPLGFRAGTQFIYGRFEFPLSMSIGMTWQTYLDNGYYGLYMKAGAAAYFRVTHEWSFGLASSLGWFPQWTNDRSHNVNGSFVTTMLSARYHF